MFGPSFVMQYLVSFLVLQSSSLGGRERERETERDRERERKNNSIARDRQRGRERTVCLNVIVFLMSCDCYCSVAPPHGALGWSAVCDCGISGHAHLHFCHTLKE